jgi:hypothetical protein
MIMLHKTETDSMAKVKFDSEPKSVNRKAWGSRLVGSAYPSLVKCFSKREIQWRGC